MHLQIQKRKNYHTKLRTFKVDNDDTRTTSNNVVLVSLLLPLKHSENLNYVFTGEFNYIVFPTIRVNTCSKSTIKK